MNRLKDIWRATWRIAVCVFLLAWIFHTIFRNEAKEQLGDQWKSLSGAEQFHKAWTIGPHALWHELSRVHPAALAASLLCIGVVVMLNVIRWRMILKVQGLDLSLSRATSISFVAQFFNSFLLGSSGGDLIKAYYAARETHHKKTEAVTTVFVDRLIGLWSMLLFAVLMSAMDINIVLKYKRYWGLSLIILGMFVALSIVLAIAFWGGVSKRFPRARHLLRRLPKGETLERSLDSCREFGKKTASVIRHRRSLSYPEFILRFPGSLPRKKPRRQCNPSPFCRRADRFLHFRDAHHAQRPRSPRKPFRPFAGRSKRPPNRRIILELTSVRRRPLLEHGRRRRLHGPEGKRTPRGSRPPTARRRKRLIAIPVRITA